MGAENVYVMMEHLTKHGQSKILEQCSYPLTGLECVNRAYTDIGTFEFQAGKVFVLELVAAHTPEYVQSITAVDLDFSKLK